MNEPRERVERGAAWLDKVAPGWESKIDHQTLSLESATGCVLGQVFGSFAVGLTTIVLTCPAPGDGLLGDMDPWTDPQREGLLKEWLTLLVERTESKQTEKEKAHV